MNERFVSQKYANTNYAPGIATYGVDGKDGKSGTAGTSVFVVQQNSLSSAEDISKFGQLISQNRSTTDESVVLRRRYINGDTFIFSNNHLYKITDIETLRSLGGKLTKNGISSCLELVSVVSTEDSDEIIYQGDQQNEQILQLDTANYKGFVLNMSNATVQNIDSPATIVND